MRALCFSHGRPCAYHIAFYAGGKISVRLERMFHPFWTKTVLYVEPPEVRHTDSVPNRGLLVSSLLGFVPDVEIYITSLMEFVLLIVHFCYFYFELSWINKTQTITNANLKDKTINSLKIRYENNNNFGTKYAIYTYTLLFFVNTKKYQLLISFINLFDMNNPSMHGKVLNHESYVNVICVYLYKNCFLFKLTSSSFCSMLKKCIYFKSFMYDNVREVNTNISLSTAKLLDIYYYAYGSSILEWYNLTHIDHG